MSRLSRQIEFVATIVERLLLLFGKNGYGPASCKLKLEWQVQLVKESWERATTYLLTSRSCFSAATLLFSTSNA